MKFRDLNHLKKLSDWARVNGLTTCLAILSATTLLTTFACKRSGDMSGSSGTVYHGHGIQMTLPSGWSVFDGPWSLGGKTKGQPVLTAYQGKWWTAQQPAPNIGINVETIESGGAKSSKDLYLHDLSRWGVKPVGPSGTGPPEFGSWKLKQTDAQYIYWSSGGESSLYVYILGSNGIAYWLQCYAPQKQMAAEIPVFRSIIESIKFDP